MSDGVSSDAVAAASLERLEKNLFKGIFRTLNKRNLYTNDDSCCTWTSLQLVLELSFLSHSLSCQLLRVGAWQWWPGWQVLKGASDPGGVGRQ